MAEWWEEFFVGPWLDVQRSMWSEEQTSEQVDRIEKAMALLPPAAVLDVPCGEGRISLALAGRGYQVTGVDISEAFLEDARRKAFELGLTIEFQHSDMRDISFETEFDGAVCFWGSFGYFDVEGDERFAKAVAHALRPGGRFLVDIPSLETLVRDFRDRSWFEAAGIYVLIESAIDFGTGRVESDWTFMGEGRAPLTRHASIRLYSFHELRTLLERAGFASIEGYDAATLEAFGPNARRLLLVAMKAQD
jgi:SAM-dependent methyltransferase